MISLKEMIKSNLSNQVGLQILGLVLKVVEVLRPLINLQIRNYRERKKNLSLVKNKKKKLLQQNNLIYNILISALVSFKRAALKR